MLSMCLKYVLNLFKKTYFYLILVIHKDQSCVPYLESLMEDIEQGEMLELYGQDIYLSLE
jgi:hypothetical protein